MGCVHVVKIVRKLFTKWWFTHSPRLDRWMLIGWVFARARVRMIVLIAHSLKQNEQKNLLDQDRICKRKY